MPGHPPNLLFSTFAFLSFFLAGIPLPWHAQSWNMGSSMFMVWTSLGCLILFADSVVWNDNVINWAPVWCDITSHYLIGAGVGLPASSFCIVRRLYYMTKMQTVSVDKAQRRGETMIDVSIGIGIPCVVMALYYVVQGHRFSISEQFGCYSYVYSVSLAFPLILMWPLIIGSISLVYAVLTFHRALKQRQRLRKVLREGFSISSGYYWRLMALCCSEIIFSVPLSTYVIVANVILDPPISNASWATIHSDFSQIPQYPTVTWQNDPGSAIGLEMIRWIYILCAFVCFAFFGCARGVRSFYGQMFWSICCHIWYSKSPVLEPPSTTSRTKRIFACAGRRMLPVYNDDRQIGVNGLSLPFQARVRRRPGSETFLSSEPMSIVSTHHAHTIASESIPAPPEPALAREHQSFDVAQLV